MSRLRRLVLSERWFFVTCRVHRTRVNLSESEFAILARAIQERRAAHRFLLTAWVFLPDHWHAIILPRSPITISRAMESIKVSATCSGVTTKYVYDGVGQRAAKTNASGAVTEADLYNTAGQVIWRYNGAGASLEGEVWAGGAHLAIYANGQTYFPLTDQVGTERTRFVYTSGGIAESCMSQPFGDNLSCTGTDSSPYKFGKLQRDAESGDDHAQHRDYNSTPFRWLTPDPAGVKVVSLTDPQTWNMYAYVGNNPLGRSDPSGLACVAGFTIFGSHFGGKCPGDTPPPPPPSKAPPLEKNQQALTATMAPTRPSKRDETVYQIGGIINHEAGGMSDSKSENKPLSQAREDIGYARINGDKVFGDKVDRRAKMADPIYSGPAFQASLDAAANAAYQDAKGVDPTRGATQMNMRTSMDDTSGFEGKTLHTQRGPYQSESKYKVINTYGSDDD